MSKNPFNAGDWPFQEEIIGFAESQKWLEPRPIQKELWSKSIIDGESHDVIVSAPTATGKTEAVFLPIVSSSDHSVEGIQTIYICPQRALIDQQKERLHPIFEKRGMGAWKRHGEASSGSGNVEFGVTKNAWQKGGVLITTPETLEGILRKRQHLNTFPYLRWVVVDELHSFFHGPRGTQLIAQLARLEAELGPFQRVALSATLSDSSEVHAKEFLRPEDQGRVQVVRDKTPISRTSYHLSSFLEPDLGKDGESAYKKIASAIRKDIVDRVVKKGDSTSKALVFGNSRSIVDRLTADLDSGKHSGNVFSHHGSLDPKIRREAEAFLRDEKSSGVVVSTPTLELGIDIGTIDLVGQVDAGPTVSSLRQRLGRSGRSHGKVSELKVFVTDFPHEKKSHPLTKLHLGVFQAVAQLELILKQEFEEPDTHKCNLSTFYQQLLSMARNGVHWENVVETLIDNGPFKDEFLHVYEHAMEHLKRKNTADPRFPLLQEKNNTLELTQTGEDYVSNPRFGVSFPTVTQFSVRQGSELLGSIPIGHQLRSGDPIIFAGRFLKVSKIVMRPPTIFVTPSSSGRPARFAGSTLSPSEDVVRQMKEIYTTGKCSKKIGLSAQARSSFNAGAKEARLLELDQNSLHEFGNEVVLFPWCGPKTQTTLTLKLRSFGLPAKEAGVAIIIGGVGEKRVRETLEKIAIGQHPNAADMVRSLSTLRIEPHDKLSSLYLARENYAANNLDIVGSQKCAQTICEASVPSEASGASA